MKNIYGYTRNEIKDMLNEKSVFFGGRSCAMKPQYLKNVLNGKRKYEKEIIEDMIFLWKNVLNYTKDMKTIKETIERKNRKVADVILEIKRTLYAEKKLSPELIDLIYTYEDNELSEHCLESRIYWLYRVGSMLMSIIDHARVEKLPYCDFTDEKFAEYAYSFLTEEFIKRLNKNYESRDKLDVYTSIPREDFLFILKYGRILYEDVERTGRYQHIAKGHYLMDDECHLVEPKWMEKFVSITEFLKDIGIDLKTYTPAQSDIESITKYYFMYDYDEKCEAALKAYPLTSDEIKNIEQWRQDRKEFIFGTLKGKPEEQKKNNIHMYMNDYVVPEMFRIKSEEEFAKWDAMVLAARKEGKAFAPGELDIKGLFD
jgi:hypothetical protein